MQFENLLGLPLRLVRASIEGEIVVVQTAPPFLARGYTPHWGEERVLRIRELPEGKIELLVASELVGEERSPFKDKRSSHKQESSIKGDGTNR